MDIREKINKLIENREVRMKSRLIFSLKRIGIILVIALFSLFTLFLISLIGFRLRIQGLWILGPGGFLSHFPWGILLAVVGLILILEFLTKEFSYKKPLIYSLVVILVIVVLGSFALDRIGVHDRLQQRGFYRERTIKDLYHGVIRNYMDNEFDLNEFHVKVMPYTEIIKIHEFKNGMEVMVFGREINKIIEAKSISRKPQFRIMK